MNHAIDFDKAGFVLNQTNRGMGALAKGFLYGNMRGAMGEFGLQFLKDFKNFQAGNYDTTAWGAWMTKISQDAINLPLRPAGFVP